MPVIKSAIKKLRQDRKREKHNDEMRVALQTAVRAAKKSKSSKSVTKAISTVDKAAKNRIIHANKAARLKSSLNKLAKPTKLKTEPKETAKKVAVKKTPTKKTPTKKTSK